MVGWPASTADVPGAGCPSGPPGVPVGAAELMQSHSRGLLFWHLLTNPEAAASLSFCLEKSPRPLTCACPGLDWRVPFAAAPGRFPGQSGRFGGKLCQPFPVQLGCRHRGAGRRLGGESRCQVSLEDAAGLRLPAREYRLGVSFEICLLGLE